jgi:hypothetical protein
LAAAWNLGSISVSVECSRETEMGLREASKSAGRLWWPGLLLGLSLVFVWPSCAEDKVDLQCLEEIELPRFSAWSLRPEGGTAHALVTLAENGKIAATTVEGTAWELEAEVRYAVQKMAKYRSGCEGRQVAFDFEFRVEGEETHYPVIRIYFRPPNGFLVVTPPGKMTVTFIPVDKDQKKKPQAAPK